MKDIPGPWLREGNTVYALRDVIFAGKPAKENIFSCSVQGAHITDDDKKNIARLIAAAPEMLAALKSVLHMLIACEDNNCDGGQQGCDVCQEFHKINAIIRAAEEGE